MKSWLKKVVVGFFFKRYLFSITFEAQIRRFRLGAKLNSNELKLYAGRTFGSVKDWRCLYKLIWAERFHRLIIKLFIHLFYFSYFISKLIWKEKKSNTSNILLFTSRLTAVKQKVVSLLYLKSRALMWIQTRFSFSRRLLSFMSEKHKWAVVVFLSVFTGTTDLGGLSESLIGSGGDF